MMGDRTESSPDLTEEDIHGVLSNERRRIVIDSLQEDGGEMTVRELSERIAALETGEEPPPRNIRQSAYSSLHQNHLPKLDDLEIIDYDSDSKHIERRDSIDQVAVYTEAVPKYGISWSEYYVGLSVVAFLVIVGSEIGMPILSILPGSTWAYLSLAFIGASAIYQTYRQGNSILTRLRA